MPVHDWTRVRPGTLHDFHGSWMMHLKEALNGGLLPAGYYALAEQPAGEAWPDVLALEAVEPVSDAQAEAAGGVIGAVAVAQRPPQVQLTVTAESEQLSLRQRTLVIRHATGDRIVAMLEIVSPGNKDRRQAADPGRLRSEARSHGLCGTDRGGRRPAGNAAVSASRLVRQRAAGDYLPASLAGFPRTLAAGRSSRTGTGLKPDAKAWEAPTLDAPPGNAA